MLLAAAAFLSEEHLDLARRRGAAKIAHPTHQTESKTPEPVVALVREGGSAVGVKSGVAGVSGSWEGFASRGASSFPAGSPRPHRWTGVPEARVRAEEDSLDEDEAALVLALVPSGGDGVCTGAVTQDGSTVTQAGRSGEGWVTQAGHEQGPTPHTHTHSHDLAEMEHPAGSGAVGAGLSVLTGAWGGGEATMSNRAVSSSEVRWRMSLPDDKQTDREGGKEGGKEAGWQDR